MTSLDQRATSAPTNPPGFAELSVPAPIVAALVRLGIERPLPIQAATLPDSLAGRDVLGRGKTGSGKTIAFAIPTVSMIAAARTRRRPRHPRALVLVPTRELASQVATAFAPMAQAMSLTYATVFGGVGQGRQVAALRAGVDILIACPGRLEDLIAQRHCSLDDVTVTVLDEADHMADLGFLPAVRRILDRTSAAGQRMLFSATLDGAVEGLVRTYTRDAAVHELDRDEPAPMITHYVFAVSTVDKRTVVRDLAAGAGRSLLFTRTKHSARKLAKQLSASGVPALELHGNLSQRARERNLASFSSGRTGVLVATDIAARGIHVDDIALVVHVDPPIEHKAYLHRSGRTARAGADGIVVTLATPEQAGDVRRLTRAAGISPIFSSVRAGEAVSRLADPSASPATPESPPRRDGAEPRRDGTKPRREGAPSRARQSRPRRRHPRQRSRR